MKALESFYFKNLKYSLLNKFVYKNFLKLPKLNKIVLSFRSSDSNLKKVAISFLALEIISSKSKSSEIIIAKKPNLILKIKEGSPIGCKIVLFKKSMFLFLNKIIFQMKIFKTKNFQTNVYSFLIKMQSFQAVRTFYSLFNDFENELGLNIVFSKNCKNEIAFLLKKMLSFDTLM